MLSGTSTTTLHKVFPVLCSPRTWYSWDNIAQIKTLASVVLEAPDNNAKEKILLNLVLILLRQYCTSQSPMRCCPRGSGQHCAGKILYNVILKSDSHLPKKMSDFLHWKPFKNDEKCFLFHRKSSFRSQGI